VKSSAFHPRSPADGYPESVNFRTKSPDELQMFPWLHSVVNKILYPAGRGTSLQPTLKERNAVNACEQTKNPEWLFVVLATTGSWLGGSGTENPQFVALLEPVSVATIWA
jgi:hypothetical protein